MLKAIEIKISKLINWEISFLSDSQKNVFWFELIIMTKDAGIVCSISYNYKIRFTGKKGGLDLSRVCLDKNLNTAKSWFKCLDFKNLDETKKNESQQ